MTVIDIKSLLPNASEAVLRLNSETTHHPSDSIVIQFSLPFPFSKKNSKRIVLHSGKPRIISSAKYMDWETKAVRIIQRTVGFPRPLPWPVCVSISLVMPDKRPRDLSNLCEGVMDAMVRAGLLVDDSWKHVRTLSVSYSGVDPVKAGATVHLRRSHLDLSP